METIEIHGEIVEFWSYRKAIVYSAVVIRVPRISAIVREYVESNGHKMDNHICWKTSCGLYYMYSDHTLYIGDSIDVRSW